MFMKCEVGFKSMTLQQRFRVGAIEATVWKNQGIKDGVMTDFYSISFGRSYKDKTGMWHCAKSVDAAEIPLMIALLTRAHRWCTDQRKKDYQEIQKLSGSYHGDADDYR